MLLSYIYPSKQKIRKADGVTVLRIFIISRDKGIVQIFDAENSTLEYHNDVRNCTPLSKRRKI